MSETTGQCMCGAVRFRATDVPDHFGVCHCEMCRRWTGSAFANVEVPEGSVTWEGEAQIATLQSSRWAERAWCRRCGSGLYWHMTQGGDYSGTYDIALGLFDEPDAFKIASEIYTDLKPHGFNLVDEGQKKLTRAECVAKFPPLAEEH